jgi:prevent-host-death family protein
MSIQVNVHDAKTHFSALLERVAAGEEIIIAKAGKPVARLTTLAPTASGARVPGSRAGRMWMADDFDEPLPDDFLSGEPR